MDVKTGSGAFMPTLEGARDLAESIADVANGAGLPTVALITDMNEPLASAAGNAVEVRNAVDYLTGARRDARLHAVTLALGAELLALARPGARPSRPRAPRWSARSPSGAAAERFERMVAALGGPDDFLAKAARASAARAGRRRARRPERAGSSRAIDVRAVGLAVVELGGGRARASDAIDPAVGLTGSPASAPKSAPRRAAGARPRARRSVGARGGVERLRARLSHRRRAAGARRSGRSRASPRARA